MTTEQKAKAYDEALKWMRELYHNMGIAAKEKAESIFPELKESEDERIRKALVRFHKSTIDVDGIKGEDIIAWLEKQETSYTKRDVDDAYVEGMAFAKNELEKQGEKKPIDKIQLGKKYKCIASPRYSTFRRGNIYKPVDNFLCNLMNLCYECFEPIEDSEQKPTDEDMKEALRTEYEKGRADAFAQMQNEWSEEDEVLLSSIINTLEMIEGSGASKMKIDFLNSLKERYTWKPSDEQMSALKIATHCPDLGLSRVLKTLYNDLDKLTKE